MIWLNIENVAHAAFYACAALFFGGMAVYMIEFGSTKGMKRLAIVGLTVALYAICKAFGL